MLPQIDFNYWYERNIEISNSSIRFVSMITRINNIYEKDNNFNQAYFCGNQNEINRLKQLNYNQLENEIIILIRNKKDEADFSDMEVLKIFDLIQIWGGLTGGSNPYKIKDNSSVRLNYKNWIKEYKRLINLSINQNIESYKFVIEKNIPCLNMSFGSKHISFWSRKEEDDNCLVVIDNKISGVSGVKTASEADFKLIIENVFKISNEFNLKPYQIEKALFTFHKYYFDNNNSKFNEVDVNSIDYDVANNLKEFLKIGLINNSKDSKKAFKFIQKSKFIISKYECLKINNEVYISMEYVSKTVKIKGLINKLSFITKEKKIFYKYDGDKDRLRVN